MDLAAAVNLTNWRARPFSRWSFRNVDKFMPTATVHADPSVAAPLSRSRRTMRSLLLNGIVLDMIKADAVVALKDGKIVYERYANGNDMHTPHIIMSATKAVVGLLAGALDRGGELSLASRVSDCLPELGGTAYAHATLRDLLDMRSGVVLNTQQQRSYEAATNWSAAAEGETGADLRSFFKGLAGPPTRPGGPFGYNSSDTDLLGWVIERATGHNLADLLSQRIWRPLGAQDDAFITLDRTGLARAAGGLCVTARDLARLGQLILDDGRHGSSQVVPPEVVEDILSNGDPEAWAAGAWAKSFSTLGQDMSYRSGWYVVNGEPRTLFAMGVHGQNLFVDRERKLVVAKMSSWSEPIERLPIYLTHQLFRGLQRRFPCAPSAD